MNLTSLFNSIPDTLRKLEHVSFKAKIIAFFTTFLAPLHEFMLVLIFFVIIDMIASVYLQIKVKKRKCKAKKIEKPEYQKYVLKSAWRIIDPQKLPNTVEKVVAYAIALIICFILDHHVLRTYPDEMGRVPMISITNVVYMVLLITEAVSILRHLGRITGNTVFDSIIQILVKKTKTEEYIPHPNTMKNENATKNNN